MLYNKTVKSFEKRGKLLTRIISIQLDVTQYFTLSIARSQPVCWTSVVKQFIRPSLLVTMDNGRANILLCQ